MPLLTDLVSAETKAQVLDTLVGLFRLSNFPVASWQPFTIIRHLVEASSSMLSDKATLIASIAKGGLLDLAEDDWLTLYVKSAYQEDRKPAVATRGYVTLTDANGSGPHPVTAGEWWVGKVGSDLRWKVIEDGTVPAGGSVSLLAEAESPGAAWNVASGTLNDVTTPGGTGVVVSNPALESGTWITQQGADIEKDPALRQRCRDKWATLGTGSTIGAYRYWALSASSEITRCLPVPNTENGSVAVTIAGPSGPVSLEALTLARAAIEANRPLCSLAPTDNALGELISIAGTVYLDAGANADVVLAACQSAIDAYARSLDIGATIYLSRIVALIQDVKGVRNVVLSNPGADVVLSASGVFVPTYNLVVVP